MCGDIQWEGYIIVPRAIKQKPTDFELAILTVLWERKSATVREVYEALLPTHPELIATTVHKIMGLMIEKGMLKSLPDRRPYVFVPLVEQKKVQKNLIAELIDRAFSGSATRLIMQALSTKKSSPEELAQIRKLIEKAENEQ